MLRRSPSIGGLLQWATRRWSTGRAFRAARWPILCLSMASLGCENLIDGNDDLERDQQHDDDLEAKRASCIDDVGKRVRCLGDDGKLSVERIDTLLELILVLQTRIQPL